MKYPGYFLIVSDFIQWAKAQGIPVGPAAAPVPARLSPTRSPSPISIRSASASCSSASSIPSGCRCPTSTSTSARTGATRSSAMCRNATAAIGGADHHLRHAAGARRAARRRARAADAAWQVDKFCKLVPQNPLNPVTLGRAIDDEPRPQAARDGDPVVRRAFDIAQKLEGLHRHASTHAAGIVIGERPLTEMVPLYRDPKSLMPVTQFNMKWVEQAGLVKFDFLGLKTLTVLETAVTLARSAASRSISPRSRSTTRRPTPCWRVPKRWASSSWKVRACGGRCSTCGPTASRTSSRWSRSIGRADGEPDLLCAQARPRAARLHPSQARS